jgi:diguanylate cyclase (GGDEF)-like protein
MTAGTGDKKSILVVDDERSNIMALTNMLASEYNVYAAKNGPDALDVAKEYLPDLILLDILMPDMDGYEVLSQLKADEDTQSIPVIFITGLDGSDNEEKGLKMGAVDYINKPFSVSVVTRRIRNQVQLQSQYDTIKHLSMTDQLTGLPNRRSFDHRMRLDWNRAKRDKTFLSVLIIDIDKFKPYNDQYGHLQGDTALQVVADAIGKTLKRSTDFAARWGGEEFIVLLPGNDANGSSEMAEKIRANIEDALIPCGADTLAAKLTASVGVNTASPQKDDSVLEFISAADKALYAAKDAGRNRVCRAGS